MIGQFNNYSGQLTIFNHHKKNSLYKKVRYL